MTRQIDRPIFFIGMPRSGTTLLFATFAAHPDLGWFSQYHERFPSLPGVGAMARAADLVPSSRKGVRRHTDVRRLTQRLQIAPTEAWTIWERCCGSKFSFEYLEGVQATEEERSCVQRTVGRTLRLQGKPRFATKITGPARIEYLSSIFEDAIFIHVIRDGRAAAESLMRVAFWKDTFRLNLPAWRGGLDEADLAAWRERGSEPLELAALQWRTIVTGARREAAQHAEGRYHEVRFEDYISDPHTTIDALFDHAGLGPAERVHGYIDERLELRDLTSSWRQRVSEPEVEALDALCGDLLAELGYETGAEAGAGRAGPRDRLTGSEDAPRPGPARGRRNLRGALPPILEEDDAPAGPTSTTCVRPAARSSPRTTRRRPTRPPLWGRVECESPARQRRVGKGGDPALTATGRRQGNAAYRRLSVRDGDDYYGERCELGRNNHRPSQPTFALGREGERRAFFFSIRLTRRFPLKGNAWQSVVQLKQAQPSANGSGSPQLGLHASARTFSLHAAGEPLWSVPARRNFWMRFVLDVNFSQESTTAGSGCGSTATADGDTLDSRERSRLIRLATLKTETEGGTDDDGIDPGESIPAHLRVGIYHDDSYDCPAPRGCVVHFDNVQVVDLDDAE